MDRHNKIICLLGGAGSGKDTVRGKFMIHWNSQLNEAISYTTRPMRASEKGSEYYFIDKDTFRSMYESGMFAETRTYKVIGDEPGTYDTWYYGYTTEELDRMLKIGNVLLIIDLDGFKEIKSIYHENCIGFYLDVTRDERLRRYINRDNINWKNVTEAIRRIEDDDNRAFKDYEDWVDYEIKAENSQDMYNEILNKLLDDGILKQLDVEKI